MSKVQIVFGQGSAELVGRTVNAVLAVVPDFGGLRWGKSVDDETELVIFIADIPDGWQIDLAPFRAALYIGLTVFIVAGHEGTVSPADLSGITGEEHIYFFQAMVPVSLP